MATFSENVKDMTNYSIGYENDSRKYVEDNGSYWIKHIYGLPVDEIITLKKLIGKFATK